MYGDEKNTLFPLYHFLRRRAAQVLVNLKYYSVLHDATSCSMCRRLIINAGIDRVVIRNTEREYSVVHVEDWVREDDSLPQQV